MNTNVLRQRLLRKVHRRLGDACWPFTMATQSQGYGQLVIKGKRVYVHRLSYRVHKGPIPRGLVVMHSCDNPRCANPKHLTAGTQATNVADAAAKGRYRGESNGNAKLTEAKVRAIRADPRRYTTIGRKYGIDPCYVSQIKHRKTWSHVA